MAGRTSKVATAGVMAMVVTALATSLVLASGPVRVVDEVHLNDTFPAGTRCPFEVVRTVDGTLVTTTFVGADGLTRQTLFFRPGFIGYVNPANGKTLTAVLAGPVITADNGDGTSTVTIPGNDQRYTAPGLGFIVGNTGLLIATVDNTTGEVLSIGKLAGHQDGTPFPALCVGLV